MPAAEFTAHSVLPPRLCAVIPDHRRKPIKQETPMKTQTAFATLFAATLAAGSLLPLTASAPETMGAKAETKLDAAGQATKDTAITAKIKTKLAADRALSAMDIHVETTDGVVTLSGTVDNKAQVELAEKVVAKTRGVKSVTNNLEAKASS
jgi:hyperosmotically inducible protein